MVKSAENPTRPKNTHLNVRKQKSQSCLPKKWEQQKMKFPQKQQNGRYRYTSSTSKPVQKFTINTTVTTTHMSKRTVCNDPSKKNDISIKKETNVSLNAICGPLSYIYPTGSLSQSKDKVLSQVNDAMYKCI